MNIRMWLIRAALCGTAGMLAAQTTARAAVDAALAKGSASEAVSYLTGAAERMASEAEKRSLYVFLGSLQEQAGLYDEARASYASAAAIAAGDADGMPKRSSEQLVLDAVRCALAVGDADAAEAYLRSAVRRSANQTVQAYVKLYGVWAALCRANADDDLTAPVETLTAYAAEPGMHIVQPQVLFTLWYLTGAQKWAKELKTRYPQTLEAGMAMGTVKILPSPFWLFVPHRETVISPPDTAAIAAPPAGDAADSGGGGAVRWQLGLFREKANADRLIARVKEKGFSAYSIIEKRPSGTAYFIVLADETDGSLSARLKSAGFECYVY